jgi:hypothetical protein
MEKEKIIDKIRKLLELSKNNPNKEEAILALTKARELMFKHNVDMENIKKDDTNYFEKIVQLKKWKNWILFFLMYLNDAFGTFSLYNEYTKRVYFYGEKEKVLGVSEIFEFLFEVADYLAMKEYRNYLKEYGTGKGIYLSYILGFINGVNNALEKQNREFEEYGIVIVTSEVLKQQVRKDKNAVKKREKRLFNKNINTDLNREVFDKGYDEGITILDKKQIEGDKSVGM